MDKPNWDSSHADEARNELFAERLERHADFVRPILAEGRLQDDLLLESGLDPREFVERVG